MSARPPRTKNWVLLICYEIVCSCAIVCEMMLSMIGGMLRCCFVIVVLVFVVVVGCGGDTCGGVGVLWLTQC